MEKNKSQKAETMTFEFNEVETAAAKKFCAEHLKHALHMSAGEAFQFIIMPTMLGNFITVRCMTCGEELDLTDFDKF